MTTILGIKTNEGKEGVILAADTKLTISKEGEIVRAKKQTKLRTRGHQWAMADAGFDDKYSQKFIAYLHSTKQQDFSALVEQLKKDKNYRSPVYEVYARARNMSRMLRSKDAETGMMKELMDYATGEETTQDIFEQELAGLVRSIIDMERDPVLQAIKTRHFIELDILNRQYMSNEDNEYDDSVVLLIATSKAQGERGVGLYKAMATGQVMKSDNNEDLEYFCLGSGAEHVEEYFTKEHFDTDPETDDIRQREAIDKIEVGNITLSVAKCLAVGAMTRAAREDEGTGAFYEIAEVTEEGIQEYLRKLPEYLEQTKKGLILDELFPKND